MDADTICVVCVYLATKITSYSYSVTTLVQVLIRFQNTGDRFQKLQNILRLPPRNRLLALLTTLVQILIRF